MTGAAAFCISVLVAASAVAADEPAFSREAQGRLLRGPAFDAAADAEAFGRLVREAESHLAAGNTMAAQRAFDDAALLRHTAEVELGLVRTYMQAGGYRQAVAFAAHAAGAHREYPGGMALYAWLLKVGGQDVAAMHFLDEAIARSPTHAALLEARGALTAARLPEAGVLLQAPLRLAPYEGPAVSAVEAQVVGSGVLMRDGRTALVPAAAIASAQSTGRRIWARNGLGQRRQATVLRPLGSTGLVLLQLDAAFELPAEASNDVQLTPRAPFAGSPSYAVEYGVHSSSASAATVGTAEPAWPLLKQGFFGRGGSAQLDATARPLAIELPPGPRGGPVFDLAGRLAGVAVVSPEGVDQLIPAAAFAEVYGVGPAIELPAAAAAMSMDLIYERALLMALQIVVER